MTVLEKMVYSVDEAAEQLSIGRTLIRQLIAEGTLPSLKIGHRRLVAREDLEAFVGDVVRLIDEPSFGWRGFDLSHA